MNTPSPTLEQFQKQFEGGKTQLLWRWVDSDLETPVSAYLKLCKEDTHCFLLESVEGGKTLGRYSIIGFAPDMIWKCKSGKAEIKHTDDEQWVAQKTDALLSLREELQKSHIDHVPEGLPPMAVSGLFGYLGYDMVRLIEKIPDDNPDDLHIPDSIMMRPQILVIFDNIKQTICLVTPIYDHTGNSQQSAQFAYDKAQEILEDAVNALDKAVEPNLSKGKTQLRVPLDVQSNMTPDEYRAAVSKVVDYTHQGEIFQGVPSQRFSVDYDLPSFAFYRSLRRLNPSPFMFYLSFDGFQIAGASPEILVRVRDEEVTIRAIAGTRKRGKDAAEDKALAEDMLADEKECAEHLMLLDLGRNDVGRVSEFGSVNVTEQFVVEYYSHVMHIVSNITGKLKKGLSVIDALFAGFPAGTLSGAPKVRAMEIIDEVEVSRRGIYAGGIGYVSANGTLDTCIAIRTALIKDGKLYVQAGAGVVADSDPESEHQECINKSKALIHAAEMTIEAARKAQG